MAIALLTGQSTNGSGTAVTLDTKVDGNQIGIQVFGNLGGGTVAIEIALDGTNFSAMDTFTAAAFRNYKIAVDKGSKIRATLSGSTGASVYCSMSGALTGITRTDA